MNNYEKFFNNLKNYIIYLQKIGKELFNIKDLSFSIRNFQRFLEMIYTNKFHAKCIEDPEKAQMIFKAAIEINYDNYLSIDTENNSTLFYFKLNDKKYRKLLIELYESFLNVRYLKTYYHKHEAEIRGILCDYNINNFITNEEMKSFCERVKKGIYKGLTICGPSGSGTTFFARQMADKLNLKTINFSITYGTQALDFKPIFEACEHKNFIIIDGLESINNFAEESIKIYHCLLALTAIKRTFCFDDKVYHKNSSCIIAMIYHPDLVSDLNNNLRALLRCYPVCNYTPPYPVCDYTSPIDTKKFLSACRSGYGDKLAEVIKEGNKRCNLKYIQLEKENNKNMKNENKKMKNGLINNVYYNDKKGATVVEFWNGDKIRVTRRKEDKHDLEKAIAIAMVKYAYGLDAYLEACDNAIDSTKKPKEKKKAPVKKETSKSTAKEVK